MAEDSMRERILDAAEGRARQSGYHGFSFRELAADVGIKSASVHYHFPTKAELAEALTDRYAQAASERLGAPETPLDAFDRVAALFRNAILVDDKMCLCGVFGAERDGLPPEVAAATERYFRSLIALLEGAEQNAAAPYRAETILSAFEGALLLVKATGDRSVFDRVVEDLRRAYGAAS